MTVAELIEQLEQLNGDAQVLIGTGDYIGSYRPPRVDTLGNWIKPCDGGPNWIEHREEGEHEGITL
jgi:hypothetical protein